MNLQHQRIAELCPALKLERVADHCPVLAQQAGRSSASATSWRNCCEPSRAFASNAAASC